MLLAINTLNLLLPVFYAAMLVIYAIDFYNDKISLPKTQRSVLLATLILHFSYIILRTLEFSHGPITNKFEIFTSIAFTLTLAYMIIEIVTGIRRTGLFIILFALLFQVFSSLFISPNYIVHEKLRNPLLGFHVITALLGQSGLLISAVYGLLFILLYNRIKSHNFGSYFNKLPSLETLESMSFKALVIGYSILTVALIIGAIWLPIAFPNFTHYDPKLISTTFIWLVYSFGITAKKFFRWYGKKVIYLSIVGFVIMIFSMILTLVMKSSFHSFR